ncbi:hypothetical protein [Corynebacterium lubricantis]|uniref:hypothetical protein n=1 Tax=Corynebacterium lubricantis TaxID=541095 RepID=UPI0003764DD1|nr:hypothetical protein [Corynebacterium lubricantis]
MKVSRQLARRLLIGAVLLATASTTACGNFLNVQRDGIVGISRDAADNVVIHVNTCENSTNRIEIYAGREELDPEEENELIGIYVSPEPVQGVIEVPINEPGEWVAEFPLTLPENPEHLFIAMAVPTNQGGPEPIRASRFFTESSTSMTALAAYDPGDIAVEFLGMGESPISQEQFADVCDHLEI